MKPLPMLATPTSPASGRQGVSFEQLMNSGGWVADTKIDGVRCLARWDGKQIHLTNRIGSTVDYRYPEVVTALTDVLAGVEPMFLDGEIVARDGRFESTLLRDKQEDRRAIEQLQGSKPVMFVAFDAPDAISPWSARRLLLDEIATDWPTSAHAATLTTTVTSLDPGFLDMTRELGMEGAVAKREDSRYQFGQRAKTWLKFRNRFRVTCLVDSYTPGSGSRAEFGAMELRLLDGDQLVDVGRCGTGFTDREIKFLKLALDRGEQLAVEIECTNRTSGNTLRFPVYKGVRNDVPHSDCTIDQLQFLPYC